MKDRLGNSPHPWTKQYVGDGTVPSKAVRNPGPKATGATPAGAEVQRAKKRNSNPLGPIAYVVNNKKK